MKNVKLFVAVLLVIVMIFAVVACNVNGNDNNNDKIVLSLADGASLVLKVGDTDVDFTQYFTITDVDGSSVAVTNEMLDLSKVDLSKEGTFDITLSYGGTLLTVTITVEVNEVALEDILNKYSDSTNWNFVIEGVVFVDGKLDLSDYFGYNGKDIMYKYEVTENGISKVYTDYIRPTDDEDVLYKYYLDMGNGKYTIIDITEELYETEDFPEIFLDNINELEFSKEDDHYVANDPQAFGDKVCKSFDDVVYTKAELYTADGEITKIVVFSDKTYNKQTHEVESTFIFTQHGKLNFDISKLVIDDEPVVDPTNIDSILKQYENVSKWNYVVNLSVSYSDGSDYAEEFSQLGNILRYEHSNLSDPSDLTMYVDYVKYLSEYKHMHYGDLGNGTYATTTIDEDYDGDIYFPMLYMDYLSGCKFNEVGDHYEAVDPQECGDSVYGSAEGCTYTKVELYVSEGKVTKIVFFSDEVYYDETYKAEGVFEISGYGTVNFDISSLEVVYGDTIENPEELKEVFAQYEDDLAWNFGFDATVKKNGATDLALTFGYDGENAYIMSSDGTTLVFDYLVYDEESDHYWLLFANSDGTHTRYTDEDLVFYYNYGQFYPLSINDLAKCPFELVGDHYEAIYPESAGNNVYGPDDGCVYTKVKLYVEDGLIKSVIFYADIEGYDENNEYVSYKEETSFEFAAYGKINIDISGLTIVDDVEEEDPELPDEPVENPEVLQEVFDKYSDIDNWNFAVDVDLIYNGESYPDYYEYDKNLVLKTEDYEGYTYSTYFDYDWSTGFYTIWYEFDPDEYLTFTYEDDEYYTLLSYSYLLDFSVLPYVEFEESDGFYSAVNPILAGNYFIGQFSDASWSAFIVRIANGNLNRIEAVLDNGMSFRISFTKFGEISLELPEEGGNNDDDSNSMTSTFIKADLSVGAGELGYTSNVGANSLDENRGLQFMQSNGPAVLTSKESVDGVVAIKLVVNTNATNGMNVSVKVGGVSLTSDGQTTVFVEKHGYTEQVYLVFVSETPLSGNVEVTLTPTQTKQSMYIASITIVKEGGEIPTPTPDPEPDPELPDEPVENPAELQEVLDKYLDMENWNFAITFEEIYEDESYSDPYEYDKYIALCNYMGEDGNIYPAYLSYDPEANIYTLWLLADDGTYVSISEEDFYFYDYYYDYYFADPSILAYIEFEGSNGVYSAKYPTLAGGYFIGEFEGYTWTKFTVTVSNGNFNKIDAVLNDGTIFRYTFGKFGEISLKLPEEGGENPDPNPNPNPDPSNVMESQDYNPETFDHENLQDKMMRVEECIGLPSEGDISVLVVPVQFKGDTITQSDLDKLNLAFNGTAQDTGWESVTSYYNKSSYGKLNLTFDIQSVFEAPRNSQYYQNYYSEAKDEYGYDLLLQQVLEYYESRIDLTKYDSNGDGCIDAVYLIYSAPVDYENDDSIYWAYVTWYFGENQYADLDVYYYLFAGFDFMDEDIDITGMAINPATYIHETGHLLGLDDYYDYDITKGSNMGVGGADMMDNTVGDHNPYSKIMLGWTEATIVNSTVTLTIGNLESTGDCILVPLDFNNSYFCEYLLIDLYSATGLNEFASEALYDGASCGVRIYHVSSSANNPFENERATFTDNDNSSSEFALIRLVEADGEYNFGSSDGYAAESDLWQAGDSLSEVFGTYTRNDGKVVNFDITINSVSATEASITITFAE